MTTVTWPLVGLALTAVLALYAAGRTAGFFGILIVGAGIVELGRLVLGRI